MSSYLAARNPDESQDRFFGEYKTDQLRESFTVFLGNHPETRVVGSVWGLSIEAWSGEQTT